MATHALSPAAVAGYRGGLYEWLTTTDHKKIGIMYVINSFLFFLIGGVFALAVRAELAVPGLQVFTNEHVYNESFSIHATVMIFLFIIPMLAGLGNYAVPLMIGAPDMAFPRINALSFWMLPMGGILLLSGFLAGGAAAEGWPSNPPLSEVGPLKSPGAGQDLWIVALVLIGTSSILGGINFLVTIFKMRAPGMTLFRMPIMVWTILVTSVLVVMATPVITSALVMLFIDRNYGGTLFLPPEGQAILYQHVFWFYAHPAMFRGQLTFSTPLIFAIGFLTMFLIGGINGAFSAAVPIDFALQDTYWVVAHLHYVLFGGSVFGMFAGIYYWFPKWTGRMLDEGLGKLHFVLMFVGFNLTFFPMHILGIQGMPRRIADYADPSWAGWNLVATIGGFVIAASMLPFLWNVFTSLRNGKVAGDDPWQGNTLEWATSSPPPPYNFDRLPEIRSERPVFDARHGHVAHGGHGGPVEEEAPAALEEGHVDSQGPGGAS